MGHRSRLLFVAGDSAFRRAAGEGLASYGFDVFTSEAKESVPDLFATLGPFDAVVLDEDLRGLRAGVTEDATGPLEKLVEEDAGLLAIKDLLDRLRAEGHRFAAFLLTATLRCDATQCAGLGLVAVVRKPFLVEELAATVRRALSSPR